MKVYSISIWSSRFFVLLETGMGMLYGSERRNGKLVKRLGKENLSVLCAKLSFPRSHRKRSQGIVSGMAVYSDCLMIRIRPFFFPFLL